MHNSLYEHPAWQNVPGQVMRPGGLTITGQAFELCQVQPGARVLDLGCGTGATLRYIHQHYHVTSLGIDVSARLLKGARRNATSAWLARAKSEDLPFASKSMDMIISECTLSLFDSDAALEECARVLKTGAFLIITDLYARNEAGIPLLRQLPTGTCIRSAMNQPQILEKINQHNFTLVAWNDCSEQLKNFPFCTLTEAAHADPFDLFIAASKAKLGYYLLVAQKPSSGQGIQPCHEFSPIILDKETKTV